MTNRLLLSWLILCGLCEVSARAAILSSLSKLFARAKSFTEFVQKDEWVTDYRRELIRLFGRERFLCESFDTILADLRRLNVLVPGFGASLWKVGGADDAPETVIVRAGGKMEKFELHSLRRPFHRVWHEVAHRGCVTAGCEKAESTVPERWASLLDGSKLYVVEKDRAFTGAAILVTPIRHGKDVFGLTATAGSGLKDARDGLLRAFAARFKLPSRWKSLARVRPPQEKDPRPRLTTISGRVLADAAEIVPLEPGASRISKALPRRCFGSGDVNGRDLLAGMEPPADPELVQGATYTGDSTITELLYTVKYPDKPGDLAKVPEKDLPELKKKLRLELSVNPNPDLRTRAAVALGMLNDGIPPVTLPSRRIASSSRGAVDFGNSAEGQSLARALADPSVEVRGMAALGLAENGVRGPAVSRGLSAPLALDQIPTVYGGGRGTGGRGIANFGRGSGADAGFGGDPGNPSDNPPPNPPRPSPSVAPPGPIADGRPPSGGTPPAGSPPETRPPPFDGAHGSGGQPGDQGPPGGPPDPGNPAEPPVDPFVAFERFTRELARDGRGLKGEEMTAVMERAAQITDPKKRKDAMALTAKMFKENPMVEGSLDGYASFVAGNQQAGDELEAAIREQPTCPLRPRGGRTDRGLPFIREAFALDRAHEPGGTGPGGTEDQRPASAEIDTCIGTETKFELKRQTLNQRGTEIAMSPVSLVDKKYQPDPKGKCMAVLYRDGVFEGPFTKYDPDVPLPGTHVPGEECDAKDKKALHWCWLPLFAECIPSPCAVLKAGAVVTVKTTDTGKAISELFSLGWAFIADSILPGASGFINEGWKAIKKKYAALGDLFSGRPTGPAAVNPEETP